jgi:hypothetical protein
LLFVSQPGWLCALVGAVFHALHSFNTTALRDGSRLHAVSTCRGLPVLDRSMSRPDASLGTFRVWLKTIPRATIKDRPTATFLSRDALANPLKRRQRRVPPWATRGHRVSGCTTPTVCPVGLSAAMLGLNHQ